MLGHLSNNSISVLRTLVGEGSAAEGRSVKGCVECLPPSVHGGKPKEVCHGWKGWTRKEPFTGCGRMKATRI